RGHPSSMEARRRTAMKAGAERFFRTSDYWKAWSAVPDLTPDIGYALRAVRPSDRRVLDVPCGRGRLLKVVRAQAPGAALFGLDVNREMIAQVRRDLPGAHAQVASVYAIPFRDRTFDTVLCHESFMHFDDPRGAHAATREGRPVPARPAPQEVRPDALRLRCEAGLAGGQRRKVSARWPRPLVAAVDAVNRRGKAVGVRLVRYTGKSRHLIHPKHLVNAPWHDWYVEHLDPADVVLDVGCANGAHTLKAARRARRVVGMDYDVAQLRVAATEA